MLSELFHPTRASLKASGCFSGARGPLHGPGIGSSSNFGTLGRGSRAFAHELGAFLLVAFDAVDVGFVLWTLLAALELGTGLPSPSHLARSAGLGRQELFQEVSDHLHVLFAVGHTQAHTRTQRKGGFKAF